jgi:hypothetical protein
VFDDVAEAYFKDPKATLSEKQRDETLGFGLDLAMITPYALAVAGSILSFILSVVTDAAKDEAKPILTEMIRRLFRRTEKSPKDIDSSPLAISTAQMARVHDLAFERARTLGLDKSRAALLADAVAGSLLLSNTPSGDARG